MPTFHFGEKVKVKIVNPRVDFSEETEFFVAEVFNDPGLGRILITARLNGLEDRFYVQLRDISKI